MLPAMVDIVPIPAFHDNYIWAIVHGDAVVVVDPGEAAPVERFLGKRRLAAILVTHHHADHVGGIARLGRKIPVFGPGAESITGVSESLSGGERIALPGVGITLRVLAVPGHTLGHLAYHGEGALFCGDTLFGAGCGRLFEGTPATMFASLSRIAELPDETQIYCAHEYTEQNLRFAALVEPHNPDIAARLRRSAELRERDLPTVPSTLAEEKATNPFLRSAIPAVREAAMRRGSGPGPVEVFAALRAWRDTC
jgi:hydroxyacylglutathione hydrolase